MNILAPGLVFIGVAALASGITALARNYALKQAVLDHPNERSLHSIPTPRGGGIAITLPVLAALLLLWVTDLLPTGVLLAIGGGGLLVGTVGWLDDKFSLSILWRACCYVAAAVWVCYWLVDRSGHYMFVYIIWVPVIVWLTNLYNFMDGSDGLAATQAVSTAFSVAILLSGQTGITQVLWVLAASASGFLVWNWPPAKIFMGDVGSCFIGFIFGAVALYTWCNDTLSLAVWLILLSVFICDSSLTLCKRMVTGQKWYQAHNQHAYQLFVRKTSSHRLLVYLLVFFNTLLLLPSAYIVVSGFVSAWVMVLCLYGFLGGVWLFVQLKYPHQKMEINH